MTSSSSEGQQKPARRPNSRVLPTIFVLPIDSLEQRIVWHDSELRKHVNRIGLWLLASVPVTAVIVGVVTHWYLESVDPASPEERLSTAFAIAASAALVYSYLILLSFVAYRRSQFILFRARQLVESAKDEVTDAESKLVSSVSDDLALASLWQITAKRLDYYHEIATQQANASFARAQSAMIAGFGILVLSMLLSLIPRSAASSIAVAAVGGLSAALSGYIGRTFIKSQESASVNLKGYFSQPLELSRFLLAERLVRDLPQDRRADGILKVIEGVVSPFQPDLAGQPWSAGGGDR